MSKRRRRFLIASFVIAALLIAVLAYWDAHPTLMCLAGPQVGDHCTVYHPNLLVGTPAP